MRILYIIPDLSGGGTERQLCYLTTELVRMGHEAHVAYSQEGPQKPDLPGVVFHRLRSRSNYDVSLFWQLLRVIRRIRPAIIQTWILQMDILGGVAAKINGIPWIIREPSSTMGYPPTWKHCLRVQVGSMANAIVSNSFGGDEYWKTKLPFSRRYVIRNGLPLYEIEGIAPALPLGLANHEASLVLFVGRLTEYGSAAKNLRSLLEALASARRKRDLSAIFCGEGPHRSELELLRHKLGLDAVVHFTGHLPAASVWALMKKASVFVSLSTYEGCPNSVMEAMACGCPLVVSDIPAHREFLDESSALFVDPTNIQQTADIMLQGLLNADASMVRASMAKQKTQGWSIAGMAQNYERLYKEYC